MGGGQAKGKKKNVQQKKNLQNILEEQATDNQYDDDALDAANLAMTIKKEDQTQTIEVFISCENLPKMDAFSLSDPIVVIFYEKEERWVELGKTEVISDNLNPKFVKTFIISFNDKRQKLRFEVYDIDDYDFIDDMEKQEFIGYVECEVYDIVGSSNFTSRTIINKKSNRKRNGIMHVRGAEYDSGANKMLFRLSSFGFVCKGEIQLKINFLTENKEWMPIYVTDPERNIQKQYVIWKDFYLPLSKFGNEENAQLKLEVEEFNKQKGAVLLGEAETTLQYMIENPGKSLRMTINGLFTGSLKVMEVKQHSRFSFLNYLVAGTKFQLMLAVDFTASNKSPDESGSLHSLSLENDYVSAMLQTLELLQHFNNESRFTLYGFGARLPPFYNIVSHCFSCNGNIFDPYIYGQPEDVINVYKQTLSAIKFHGPTIFSQIIEQAIAFSKNEKMDQVNQRYSVLIILTDGTLNDWNATVDQIYLAQSVPLSIIIIGIGDEDFSQMAKLDADDVKLYSNTYKQTVQRDIVQFVEFKKCKNNQEKLGKELLAEIPKQFLQFMELNKLFPIKGKKNNNKAATQEFIHQKIEENRKLKKKEVPQAGKLPVFLRQRKDDFLTQLVMLGYNQDIVTKIVNDGIPTMDVNLIIELISDYQKMQNPSQPVSQVITRINNRNDIDPNIVTFLKQEERVGHRVFRIRQKNKLDELLQMKRQETHQITKQFLSNLHPQESSQKKPKDQEPVPTTLEEQDEMQYQTHPKREARILQNLQSKSEQRQQKKSPERQIVSKDQQIQCREAFQVTELNKFTMIENLCLGCHENKIQLVFMPCGHACSCQDCHLENLKQKCLSCNQKVLMYAFINE